MAINLKQIIGSRVKAARTYKGLTQEKLAELVDRTVETISNVERGKNLPTLETLNNIGKTLDVPLRDFFDEETGIGDVSRSRMETELKVREMVRSLSDDDLEVAAGQIEALAKRGKSRP